MKTKMNTIPTNKRVSICIDTLSDCKTHKDREEYLTELSTDFSKSDIVDTSNPDKYLLFSLDGSERQIRECFGTITASAVYTPDYDGIIGFEISQLTLPRNERSADLFIKLLEEKQTQTYSYIVIFVRDIESPFSSRYISRLEHVLDFFNVAVSQRR